MVFDFKKKFSFHQRQTESKKINEKYPEKIPIIVQKNKNCTLDDIDILRKRIKLTEAEALYIFIDKTLPMTSHNINVLYNDYKTRKDFDGFMYVTYCNENTFG